MKIYLTMEHNRNRKIYSLWRDIQEIVGPARDWPFLIRRLFWTKNMRHFQRILIATFVYVNGLNPVIFMEWADQLNLARDRSARNHFEALFK